MDLSGFESIFLPIFPLLLNSFGIFSSVLDQNRVFLSSLSAFCEVCCFKLRILEFPFTLEFLLLPVIHVLLELDLPSLFEVIHPLDHIIRNEGQIKQKHDQIRLFSPCHLLCRRQVAILSFLIFLPVFNQFVSLSDKGSNVVEKETVLRIRQNLIPRSSLDCLLRNGAALKVLNSILISIAESVVVSHIVFFLENFVSLGESN